MKSAKKVTKPPRQVLLLPLEGPPKICPFPKDLAAWQSLVGGYITRTSWREFELVMDEDGQPRGLSPNPHMPLWLGPVVVCRKNFQPLREKDAILLREQNLWPE